MKLFGFLFCVASSVVVITAHPSITKRDAFNPNQLMYRYMNVRNNQGTYGSFHPNDLADTITDYFANGGGPDPESAGRWGMYVYNPNAHMGQYMGSVKDPGSLVPSSQMGQTGGKSGNSPTAGSSRSGYHGAQPMFNPSELNHQLMQSLQHKSSAMSPVSHGFNPDSLNSRLMASAHRYSDQFMDSPLQHGQPTTAHAHVTTGTTGKPATNPSHAHSDTSTSASTTGAPIHRMHHLPYNPDKVNAGLYTSIKYDPDSINSVSQNMPSNFGANTFSEGSPYDQQNNAGKSENNSTSGAVGNDQFVPNQMNLPEMHQTGGMGNQYSNSDESNNSNGQLASPFVAGGLGSMDGSAGGGANQNQAIPPGIPAGNQLSQTEAKRPTATGIGSMG